MNMADRYVNRLRNRRRRAWASAVCFAAFAVLSVCCFLVHVKMLKMATADADVELLDLIHLNAASSCAMFSLIWALMAGVMLGLFVSQFFWSKDRLLVELWDRVKALEAERDDRGPSPESKP